MTEEHIQKLLQLINSSSALTSAEKKEWRDLLPLMNDKQRLELEKILTSTIIEAKPLRAGNSAPSILGQPISHIANLPKLSPSLPSSNRMVATPPAFSSQQSKNTTKPQEATTKPKPPVANRINSVLEHKVRLSEPVELTTSKPEYPLELAPAPVKKPILDTDKPPASSVVSATQSLPKPVPPPMSSRDSKPVKANPVLPKPLPPLSSIKNAPKPTLVPPKPLSRPSVPAPKPVDDKKSSIGFIETGKLQKHTPMVVPDGFIESKAAKPVMSAPEVKPAPAPKSVLAIPEIPKIQNFSLPDHYSAITVADFRNLDHGFLKTTIQQFIKAGTYYDFRFSLESSPLYKSYLLLGQAVLESGGDFALAINKLKTQGKEVLTQLEFETLVDLLNLN